MHDGLSKKYATNKSIRFIMHNIHLHIHTYIHMYKIIQMIKPIKVVLSERLI